MCEAECKFHVAAMLLFYILQKKKKKKSWHSFFNISQHKLSKYNFISCR